MWKLVVASMHRVCVYCYFYGRFLVLDSFIVILFLFLFFLVMSYFFAFLCFSCIHRRLYAVGPSSPEGAQLNVRGGGFLL
jgi:hypothetical protein